MPNVSTDFQDLDHVVSAVLRTNERTLQVDASELLVGAMVRELVEDVEAIDLRRKCGHATKLSDAGLA